ncbi:MAG: ABC transporter ATP-binding protein [Azospirillaceae bacterium]
MTATAARVAAPVIGMAAPTEPEPPPALDALGISHRYGETLALDEVSLTVAPGEFVTLLGHSGSGKTTLLRVIAGLETPSRARRLAIAGRDVTGLPPAARDCTTVFQSYALFPHMSVGANIEYGLKVRGIDRAERAARAREALERVRLPGKYDRRIHQLSGGERQRVGLARSIVTNPSILLLDEPLGALDEKLRQEMQVELLHLQQSLGMAFVYVTHSQEEALTMSHRILLMRAGRVVQEGPPDALFERPASRFVADFMGIDNLIPGRAAAGAPGPGLVAMTAEGHTLVGRWTGEGPSPAPGTPVCMAVRAERVLPVVGEAIGGSSGEAPGNRLPARLVETVYKGKYRDWVTETPAGRLSARIWDGRALPDDIPAVAWAPDDCAVTAGS